MLFENGTYPAIARCGSPYLRSNGKLSFAVKCEIGDKNIVARLHIELNDGTLSEKTLERIGECFPDWDKTVEGLYNEAAFSDVDVSVTTLNEEDQNDPNKVWTRVQWLNPAGGGGGATMPEVASKDDLVAKYGSKFRALTGGKSAATPPKRKTTPPKTDDGKAPTTEECWNALEERMGKATRAKKEEEWNRILDVVADGADYENISPEDWKRVMEQCKDDNVPM